jgi:hypothetical protein
VKASVGFQRAALKATAEAPDATSSTKFLHLARSAPWDSLGERSAWVERFCGSCSRELPFQGFSVRNNEWELDGARKVLETVNAEVGAKPDVLSNKVLEPFEKGVEALPPGVLFAGEPERAWYRSYFYSALLAMGSWELTKRGNPKGAVEWAESLDDARTGAAPQFRRWFLDLCRLEADQANLDAVVADIGTLPRLGPPAIHSGRRTRR